MIAAPCATANSATRARRRYQESLADLSEQLSQDGRWLNPPRDSMVKLTVSCSDVSDQPTDTMRPWTGQPRMASALGGSIRTIIPVSEHMAVSLMPHSRPSHDSSRVCSNTLMKPRVGSEAARLGGEVCSRCHLAGSIAGHRARRPVSMAAAPVTFGDSQVLLRRTTPEGAKVSRRQAQPTLGRSETYHPTPGASY